MSTTHIPPSEGKSFWIGSSEFATLKTTGKDTGGHLRWWNWLLCLGVSHHRLATTAQMKPIASTYRLMEGGAGDPGRRERTFTAKSGSVVHIPKETLHAWRNATAESTRALLLIIPAGSESIIEEVGAPGKLSSPPPPPTTEDLERVKDLGRKYDTEYPLAAW